MRKNPSIEYKLVGRDGTGRMVVRDVDFKDSMLSAWRVVAQRVRIETDTQAAEIAEREGIAVGIPGAAMTRSLEIPAGTSKKDARAMIQRWRQTNQHFGRCGYAVPWFSLED